MAKEAVLDVTVTIAGTPYSAQMSSAGLTINRELLDTTTFSLSGWKEFVYGLKGAEVNFHFKADTDLSGLHDVLYDEIDGAASVGLAVTVALKSTGPSASVPEFALTVLAPSFDVIPAVTVGQLFEFDWAGTATGAVVRAIA